MAFVLRNIKAPLFRAYATVGAQSSSTASETRKLEQTLTKFWEKVDLAEKDDGYHILLDGKSIKTPLGFQLTVPKTKHTLAYLLAHEWKHLPSLQIKPYLVPLTSLVSRCIDLEQSHVKQDAELLTKVGDKENLKTLLLKYLDTDTLLVFSPAKDCDGKLREAQEETYRPIIKSMEEFFQPYAENGVQIKLIYMDSDVHGLVGNRQPETTVKAVRKWLDTLDFWSLVSLERATLTAKSFLSGVAILRLNNKEDTIGLTVDDIARAATLETIYQTERWGEVEDTHDVDKVDVQRNLTSASLIVYEH
ncbi:hypothetical protein KL951_000350 [Ogataea haglerorum]|nr:hypothetical protein KL951_000350 [Ogataea haglerorum]